MTKRDRCCCLPKVGHKTCESDGIFDVSLIARLRGGGGNFWYLGYWTIKSSRRYRHLWSDRSDKITTRDERPHRIVHSQTQFRDSFVRSIHLWHSWRNDFNFIIQFYCYFIIFNASILSFHIVQRGFELFRNTDLCFFLSFSLILSVIPKF